VAPRIVAAAAIAEGEVEHAIGPEEDRAAIVVPLEARLLEDDRRGLWIGLAVLADLHARQHFPHRSIGRVVEEHAAVRGELWVEGHRQQALLVELVVHRIAVVEPGRGGDGILAAIELDDAARLLGDVDEVVAVRALHKLDGAAKLRLLPEAGCRDLRDIRLGGGGSLRGRAGSRGILRHQGKAHGDQQ